MSESGTSALVGTTILKTYGLLARLGGGASEDAWRTVGRTQLRGHESRFVLAALGLQRAPAASSAHDARAITGALATLLRDHPSTHCALEWQAHEATRTPKTAVDVVWARYDVAGRLLSLEPHFDDRHEIAYERFLRGLLVELVIAAFNETRGAREVERALHLEQLVMARIDPMLARASLPIDARDAAVLWVWRVLSAVLVTFDRVDTADDPRRCTPPAFLDARSLGLGALHLRVRRVGADAVDLWAEAHAGAIDPAPLQAVLVAIAAAWGRTTAPAPRVPERVDDVIAPVPEPVPASYRDAAPDPLPAWARAVRCATGGEPPHVFEALTRVDMTPLLEVRRGLGNVGLTAMWVWALAHQPAFAGRRFTVALDVPPRSGVPAGDAEAGHTVGLLTIRPADYFPGAFIGAGFDAFHTAFAREVRRTRDRVSDGWDLLARLAAVPASQQTHQVRHLAPLAREALGTVCVTAMRGADIFLPSWHPLFVDGCIAFGDVASAGCDGKVQCTVGIKGGRRHVEACREAVRRALTAPLCGFTAS